MKTCVWRVLTQFVAAVACLCIFAGCNGKPADVESEHTENEPIDQSECELNGHRWIEATCIMPTTCMVCGEIADDVLGEHNFIDDVCTVCEASKWENLYFSFNEDTDTYRVTGFYFDDIELVIPSTYRGKAVTSVDSGAFRNCTSITSVTISDGVTSIDYEAFSGCTSLKNITIPDSVTSINYEAFSGCPNLEYTVYDNAKYLGNEGNPYLFLMAATGTDIKSCRINENTRVIYHGAFSDCTSLTDVAIPAGVMNIGELAFEGCTSLESINIPEGVTSISYKAFENCLSLKTVTIPDSVTLIDGDAFYGCSSLTSISIPESMTVIGGDAFYDCSSLDAVYITDMAKWCGITFGNYSANPLSEAGDLYLNGELVTELVIPDGVEQISDFAFAGCGGFTSLTIPESVTSIGNNAFSSQFVVIRNNSNMAIEMNDIRNSPYYAYLIVDKGGNKTYRDGYIYTDDGFVCEENNGWYILVAYIGGEDTVTLPSKLVLDGVEYDYTIDSMRGVKNVIIHKERIDSEAFDQCSSLRSIIMGNGVTCIGSYAFRACSNLRSITISNSVTSIGEYAFISCSKLANIVIPNSVTSIEDRAFLGCTRLKSITIPDSVTSIGNGAFDRCTNLRTVIIGSGVTSIGHSVFDSCSRLESISVAKGNTAYHSAGNCLIETKTKRLVAGCKNSVIPTDGSVTSIGGSAFYGCSSLASIEIPDGVTSIGSRAFYRCSNLTSIEIPDSVTSIGTAFGDCTSLEYSTYDNARYLGNKRDPYLVLIDAVNEDITSCQIHKNTKVIADWALSDCKNLKSIALPDGVTHIGECAFDYCTDLTSIEIPESVTSIGEFAFGDCKNLKSIVLPDGVTAIVERTFYRCESLTSVTIPSSVTDVHYTAFEGCTSLEYNVYDNAKYLGNKKDPYLVLVAPTDTDITSCKIHQDAKIILFAAFSECSSLESITVPFVGASADGTGNTLFGYIFGATELLKNNDFVPSGLKKVIITGGTAIYDSAFEYCSGITCITLPNSVTRIGSAAFASCRSLTSITIPDSVTSISNYTFANCSNLTDIHYSGTKDQWSKINKAETWNYNSGNYTVHCIDGDRTKADSWQ